MPHAHCFIVHILLCITVCRSPFLLLSPVAATNKNSCFTRCCTVDGHLRRRRWGVLWEETGGLRPSSTRSPPLQPVPKRSLKQPSPRTSARRWLPDETCSSSPRRLSSTAWFPGKGRVGEKSFLDSTCFIYLMYWYHCIVTPYAWTLKTVSVILVLLLSMISQKKS